MTLNINLSFFDKKWPQSFKNQPFLSENDPKIINCAKIQPFSDLKWPAYSTNEILTKFSTKLHNREILEKNEHENLNIFVLLNIFDQKSSFRGHFQIFSWSFVAIQLNNRQPIRIANSFFLRTSPEHEILNFLVKFFVRNHLLWVE